MHDSNYDIGDISSFSLSLTQEDEGFVGSVARSKVFQESRSKFHNDPIRLQQLEKEKEIKTNAKKKKREQWIMVWGSCWIQVGKGNKKNGSSSHKSKASDDSHSATMHAKQAKAAKVYHIFLFKIYM